MKDSLLKIKKDISELKYRHSFFFFFLENLQACTKETEKKRTILDKNYKSSFHETR